MDNLNKRKNMAILGAVIYLTIMTIGMYVMSHVSHYKYPDPHMMNILIYFVFFAVASSIVIYIIYFRGTGFKKIKFNLWIVEFLIFAVLVLLAQSLLGDYKNADMTLIWKIVATTIMVGIGEEMLFRGLIFTAFKEKYGVYIGILVSASIFGFLHITNIVGGAEVGATLFQMLSAGLSGIVAAWVFYKTRSLLPTIFYHGVWDMSGLLGSVVPVKVAEYLSLAQTLFETIAAVVIIVYVIRKLKSGERNPKEQDVIDVV